MNYVFLKSCNSKQPLFKIYQDFVNVKCYCKEKKLRSIMRTCKNYKTAILKSLFLFSI